jgi:hypothetical protein
MREHRVRDAAVDDRGLGHSPVNRLEAGRHLGDHARLERRQEGAELVGADVRDERAAVGPVAVEAGDVGEDDELLGPEGHGERGGGRVGVDVERDGRVRLVGCDGGDDRDAAGVELREHGRGIHRHDVAHQAEVDLDAVDDGPAATAREEPRVLARDGGRERAVRVDAAHDVAADLPGEHHADDLEHLGRGDAVSPAELALDAEAREHRADLRAAAVHDDGPEPGVAQVDDVLGEGARELLVDHRVAAELHDHDAVVEALQPRQRLDEGRRLGLGLRLVAVGGLLRDGGHVRPVCVAHQLAYALFSCT